MTKQTIMGLAPTLSSQKEGRVRTGDIDIDGFPDLFLTVNMQTVDGRTIRRSYMMSNEECTATTCNSNAVTWRQYGQPFPRRYFSTSTRMTDDFESSVITTMASEQTVMLVPMDVDEDGRLDILT